MQGGFLGSDPALLSSHTVYPILNPVLTRLRVWEQCTLQTAGAVLARVMGTDKVQGHNSGGGRIISPLLASQE